MYTIFIVNIFRLYKKYPIIVIFFSKYRTEINSSIIKSAKFEKKDTDFLKKLCGFVSSRNKI